jgi:uncharacterized protein (DUF58 family)
MSPEAEGQTTYRFLPTQFAERLRTMGISVRKQMDGGMTGLHRSPNFGSSVEFAEYRSYVPGDPIRRIDWAVYARTDRYVIRQFHDEVSVNSHVLLDISESMSFKQEGPMSKMDYACFLAAGFMYMMVQQGDTTSLMTFDSEIRDRHEPAGSLAGLRPMLTGLEAIRPKKPGNIEESLHQAAEMIPGKALIVIISDCLQEPTEVLRGVGHLSHEGKDVTVFHVLDHGELQLPGKGLYNLEFLEGDPPLVVDMAQIREAYLDRLRVYLDQVRSGCTNAGAAYHLFDTRTEVRDALLKRSVKK